MSCLDTSRERIERLMAETGLSVHQVRKRVRRGESDDSIRSWGDSFRATEAESRIRLAADMRALLRANRDEVLAILAEEGD